jgi:outer membrane protein assembly factor BamB
MAAEQSPSRRRFRWKFGLGVLSLAVLVPAGGWISYRGDLTTQVMWLYFTAPATTMVTLLWWTFLSGVGWRTRVFGLSLFLAAAAGWFILFRHKFDGAMIPHPRHRWEHPAWPLATFLLMYGWTFFTRFAWKKRLIGTASIAVVAILAGLPFAGFAVKPTDPGADYWAGLEDGQRSSESQALQKRLAWEQAKYDALTNGKRRSTQIDLSQFSPAELLRSRNVADWERWQLGDGLAAAVGCGPRSALKSERPIPDPSNWPQFRGPRRDGIVRETGLRFDWTDDNRPKNLWTDKQKIGRGWSSFAVVDGLAITQEQRGEEETVVCYDFATGTQIWTHADEAHFKSANGGNGPRATPTVVGRRVYTLGSTGILNCLNVVTGEPYWSTNILDDAGAENLSWAMAGSPLVAGNLVFVNPGNGNGKAVIAYDRFTGKIVWAAGNDMAGYSSPTLHRIHGVPQLLVFGNEALVAYDPNTGREFWRFAFVNDPKINVVLPIVHGNKVLVSSSYGGGSALLRVDLNDGKWSAKQVWAEKRFFQLKFNDGIYKDGYVYGLAESILTCIEFKTGKLVWRVRGNFGYGQVLLVGDTLVVTGENGRVTFVKAEPKRPREMPGFQALNRNLGTLGDKGLGWNHAVINRGRLLIRSDLEVACYDLTAR